jgi:hypothetical protein
MNRVRPIFLWLFSLCLLVLFGAAPLLKGAFYLGKHEGDTMHLAELVLRMAAGEWPHLDFMTPIGVLALAPIVLFVKVGVGLGHAIFYGQILVAALLLPPAIHVARSRFSGVWQYVFCASVLVLCLALVHGEAHKAVSISMHYNRWAWAVAYIIVPLAIMEPGGTGRDRLEGILIGLGLAALVLIKVTYFVALSPALLVALFARRRFGAILWALIAGLAVALAVTLLAGPQFWLAYLGDLLAVAGSDIRQQPGESLGDTITLPLYAGGSITALAGVILLRQAGRAVEGMALLLLVPGLFYITYQNFGNDPQWLCLLALIFVALRPGDMGVTNGLGWDLRRALTRAAILCLAFGLPTAINLAFSPWRHLAMDTKDFVPLLPGLPATADVLAFGPRLYTINRTLPYDGADTPFASYRSRTERPGTAMLNGEALPECQLEGGTNAWFETVTADLTAAGYGGTSLIGTDLFSAYWMFGDFKPVRGAAPWTYGGLPGIDNADYVVVPLCPMSTKLRAGMLKALAESGRSLTERRRTDLYVLLEVSKSTNP